MAADDSTNSTFYPSVHPRPDAERYMAGSSRGNDSSVVVSLADLPETKLGAPAMQSEIGVIVNIREKHFIAFILF